VFRRAIRIGFLLALAPCVLSGCLLNTPTNVVKRFVGMIKRVQWDRMEQLIDWESSERALGKRLKGDRRKFLIEVAEHITSYNISYLGDERARSNFSFFKVRKIEYLEKTDETARVRVTIKMTDKHTRTLEMTLRKVGRTWRIVITPSLFEEVYIPY